MKGAVSDDVRARLERLAKKGNGLLTARAVLEDARSVSSPLHPFFQWDDSLAAEAHRIDQARELIRSVRVLVTTKNTTVHSVAYVRAPDVNPHVQGYRAVEQLAMRPDDARAALVEEFRRVASILARARQLALVLGSADEVDQIIRGIVGLRDRYMRGEGDRSSML